MLSTELITDMQLSDDLLSEWDRLAARSQLPLMSPHFIVPWWRHLASPSAQPRIVVVRDGGVVVGVGPFYLEAHKTGTRSICRLPCGELGGRLAPIAAEDRAEEVAQAVTEALVTSTPAVAALDLQAAPQAMYWASALSTAWPRKVMRWRYQELPSPTVTIKQSTFEDWLGTKSSNFRGQMRRMRRQFAAAGGTVRLTEAATLQQDIQTFFELHAARWRGRETSNLSAIGEDLSHVLEDAGDRLSAQPGRFRLQMLEAAGETISAQLFVASGGHVLYINGGWNERFSSLRPAMLAILLAIEECFTRKDAVLDLGMVDHPYKLRFSDGSATLESTLLIPAGLRLPQTTLSVAPGAIASTARMMAKRKLSSEQRNRYRTARKRVRQLLRR